MKQLLTLLFVIVVALFTSCGSKPKVKVSQSIKTDTIAVAYVMPDGYHLDRALRTIAIGPKITDCVNRKWDFLPDTSYMIEQIVTPIDTLRDSLRRPKTDAKTGQVLLRKAFSLPVHSPYPSLFWPLIPH